MYVFFAQIASVQGFHVYVYMYLGSLRSVYMYERGLRTMCVKETYAVSICKTSLQIIYVRNGLRNMYLWKGLKRNMYEKRLWGM